MFGHARTYVLQFPVALHMFRLDHPCFTCVSHVFICFTGSNLFYHKCDTHICWCFTCFHMLHRFTYVFHVWHIWFHMCSHTYQLTYQWQFFCVNRSANSSTQKIIVLECEWTIPQTWWWPVNAFQSVWSANNMFNKIWRYVKHQC